MHKSIGILDSGLGGLSVLQQVWQDLPLESTIYIADSKHAPYGTKLKQFLCSRSLELCNFLCEQDVKAIVVACNTATTNTITYLRENITHIPIIGVEPGIKPALNISKNKKIGILATHNTLYSEEFNKLMQATGLAYKHEFGLEPIWIKQCGNGLVELIESCNINLSNNELVNLCKYYIDEIIAQGADTIVLGCTHYPFLLSIFNELYPNINFIETSKAVVNHLRNTLVSNSNNKSYINNNDVNNQIKNILYIQV
ncbi:MAG: hypothetical protein RLZZ210_332 [Pseudomonadota bacterium]